jgi:hypothetical protein
MPPTLRAGTERAGCPLGDGLNNPVRAVATFDDGSGPALFVAGDFTAVGGILATRVAKWDGASWSALGSGLDDRVNALAVYDDGVAPALYAGGAFTTAGGTSAARIAKWDGAGWSALGTGLSGTTVTVEVYALLVHDDGGGPELHAAGIFSDAGGATDLNIASWNGAT